MADGYELLKRASKSGAADYRVFNSGQWRALTSVFVEDAQLSRITPRALERFVDERLADCAGYSTINKQLSFLGRIFKLAMREGLVGSSPFNRFDMPTFRQERMGDLPGERVVAIAEHMRDQGAELYADCILVLLATGLRRSEIARLRIDTDIDIERLHLRVTGETANRVVPLVPEVVPPLERLIAAATGPTLLRDKHALGRQMSRWKPRLVKAGLLDEHEQFSPHVLRHGI